MADTDAVPNSSASPSTSASNQSNESAYHLIFQVAGAVGTGIGILGFVTFFGGAILWLRAKEANLPATDAVAAVPHNVLVATGATFLVPAVLLALLAVACIVATHLGFGSYRRYKQRRKFTEARKAKAELPLLQAAAQAATKTAEADRAWAVTKNSAAETAVRLNRDETIRNEEKEKAEEAQQAAEASEAEALEVASEAAQKQAEYETKQTEAESFRVVAEFRSELIIGAVILAIVPFANGAIFHLDLWEVLALIGIAVAMIAISVATYFSTEKFIWFGIVSFLAAGIYIGCATYISTVNNPKVEPAAALRTGRPPVVGMFIADTSSNLYLGTFPRQGVPSRLMVIPREQVTDLTIGPLLDSESARQRALALVLHECHIKISSLTANGAPGKLKPVCSRKEVAAIRVSLAVP